VSFGIQNTFSLPQPQRCLDHPLGRTHGNRDLGKDHLPDVEFGATSPACFGENHGIRGAGIYGGTKKQNRRLASKLKLNGPDEGTTRMTA